MTDVLLRHTADGGDVEVDGGRVTLDDSAATAAYLSLFGGNELDDGSASTAPKQWWGNRTEQDRTRHLRSETQSLLRSLPATEDNLLAVAEAAARDLGWMTTALAATIDVEATLSGPKRLHLEVVIVIDGVESVLRVDEQWGSE